MFHSYLIIHQDKNVRQAHINEFLAKFKLHHVDISALEDQTITVAEVRKIIAHLTLKPFASDYKAVVIPGDFLTLEAQQALLKTLEEPPLNSLIFLSVSAMDLLLPTIISRCVIKDLTANQSVSSISRSEFSQMHQFWTEVLHQRAGERLVITDNLGKDRNEVKNWLKKQILFWREMLLAQKSLTRTTSVTKQVSHSKSLSEIVTGVTVTQIMRKLIHTYWLVDKNINLKLALDHLFLALP